MDAVSFTLNGKSHRLTRSHVEEVLGGMTPEPIRSHGVVVHGRAFPVKQAFGAATGLDRLDFTSAVARRQLERLGFQLIRSVG